MIPTLIAVVTAAAVLTLFGACAGNPDQISGDLSPVEFFQKAQEAATGSRYDLAIAYYEKFLETYPEDASRGVEAEYEIAFMHYKKGETAEAKALFEALLDKYRSEAAAAYPQWPRVLAAKVLDSIEEE
jgi:outer membrane protein assembly factor BamD (BamD/ComL family)